MVVSDARIAANRRNAQKSSGPKTPEGKDTVRKNALKHGLTALVVRAEDAEAFQDRAEGFYQAHRPQNHWQSWLSEGIALITMRLDRLERIERRLRDGVCWRAMTFWDDDQRVDVERRAIELPKEPARVVAEFRQSIHGCEWLIQRWAMLAYLADRQPWTEDQRKLANNLCGTPWEVGTDAPGQEIDADGRSTGPPRSEAEVARAMIADLEARRTQVVEADEVARALAEADLSDGSTPELVRLRRYERTLQKRLRFYAAELRRESPTELANPHHKPNYFNPPESLARSGLETPVRSSDGLAIELPSFAKTNPIEPAPCFAKTNPIEPVPRVDLRPASGFASISSGDKTKPLSPAETDLTFFEKKDQLWKNEWRNPRDKDAIPGETEQKPNVTDPNRTASPRRRVDPKKAVEQLRKRRRG